MINKDQIEEWIHEVEDRPSSASVIIRYIANRLKDLSGRNEELLAENIELRTGKKVEDYESRIANLEYQLDLLRRQLGAGGDISITTPAAGTVSFLIYTPKGRVLRVEADPSGLASDTCAASFASLPSGVGLPRLLSTSPTEELLFVFDSGRTATVPVSEIPVNGRAGGDETGKMGWEDAYLVEPHGGEELVTVLPVARMTLYDCCVQVSRRGCAKKMMKAAFETHVAKSYVGSGVKGKPDKTLNLTLCGKDDLLVLASREGFATCLDVNQLPYTIEEVLKLSATDYLSASFVIGPAGQTAESRTSILFLTQNGKAIHREASWLEKPASYKSRGQAVFSQARRDAGIRIVSSVAVNENDWGAALTTNGQLTVHRVADLLEAGAVGTGDNAAEIIEFVTFSMPGAVKS